MDNLCGLPAGRDTLVGIATRYGLDGPGIESRCGRGFPPTSRTALGPWRPRCGADHTTSSSAEVKKEYNYISTPLVCLPVLLDSDVSLIHVICSRYKNFCIVQTPSGVGTKSAANSSRANNLQAGEKGFALQVQFQMTIEHAHDSGNWGKTEWNWC